MGIAFINNSKCRICNKTINKGEKLLVLPPLIGNFKDKLFKFSDGFIHENCKNKNYPERNLLLEHIGLYEKHLPPTKLKCEVEGKIIENPRDLFFIGLLTSDKKEPLHKFNYIALNRKKIRNWKYKEELIQLIKDYIKLDKWESFGSFNYLEYILNVLEGFENE